MGYTEEELLAFIARNDEHKAYYESKLAELRGSGEVTIDHENVGIVTGTWMCSCGWPGIGRSGTERSFEHHLSNTREQAMTDLDRLEALANQKRGRGYHEEQTLVGAVPTLVAEVRRLRAQVEQLESDLDAAAYRAGVTQGRIGQLQTQIKQLENQLDEVRALVGPDNESGMISASAIFHTIGTGNKGGES